jgi:hypothetical protein
MLMSYAMHALVKSMSKFHVRSDLVWSELSDLTALMMAIYGMMGPR